MCKSFKSLIISCIISVIPAGCIVVDANQVVAPADRIVLAYVTSWSTVIPDPDYLTHINYAFGHVTDSFDGVRIDNEERLIEIVKLKETAPGLKVMLSIGGWGSGRFSEMATDEKTRTSFAKDCKRVVEQFGLDGIDLDWEYPTSSAGKISSSPMDTEHFTLLFRLIRSEIGNNKLLTFASSADANYVNFKAVEPFVDFVNIMTYDIDQPPLHHAGLFRSAMTGKLSCEESVAAHHNAGVPMNKLVLGIPFYGKGARGSGGNYRTLINRTDLTEMWDDMAKAPYMVDHEGNVVTNHENPRSVAEKCKYLLESGMRGAMYWEYSQDDDNLTMVKAVYNGLMERDFRGWLRVNGNKFLDPQGQPIIFVGLCASDPDRLESENQWNDHYFGGAADWGANIIRFAVHPQAVRRRGWDAYFELMDRGVAIARQHNLYVIMDWHSIGNLKDEIFQSENYNTTLDETLKFWAEVARRYKDEPIVAMYELFNEPTVTSRFGTCTWEQWREINEQIIDTIRFYNPNALCLVAGFDWAYELRSVIVDPVRRTNIAYVSHPYPQKREKPWEEKWEADWGHVADTYPVFCTELGFCLEGERGAHVPVISDMTYGPELTAYFEKKGISFAAWCFDISWAPALITDWDFTPTTQGKFFREYLQRRK